MTSWFFLQFGSLAFLLMMKFFVSARNIDCHNIFSPPSFTLLCYYRRHLVFAQNIVVHHNSRA